jgi:hypothetical protein
MKKVRLTVQDISNLTQLRKLDAFEEAFEDLS